MPAMHVKHFTPQDPAVASLRLAAGSLAENR
jgi:hypothetical protein